MKKKLFYLIVKFVKVTGINKLFHILYQLTQKKPIELTANDKVFGEFTDSFNNKHKLHTEIRDLIKPNWRVMFKPPKALKPASKEQVASKLSMWKKSLYSVESYLNTFGHSIRSKDIMEIGAFDGATSYALAEFGAKSVLGTDIAAYYMTQTLEKKISEKEINEQNDILARLRDVFEKNTGNTTDQKVSFAEDNIINSQLADESKDVIVSWEVLEHLIDPVQAFKEITRVLRPNGISFHEYNPFFSIYGGHSLCTLDFFWGHARLNSQDFEKYITTYRAQEKDVALGFYHNSLNRMSIQSLKEYAKEAGLTVLSILPLIDKSHIKHLNRDVIMQVKNLYPNVETEDLIAPFIWVVFKKE